MRTLRILIPVVMAILALEAPGAVLVERSAPNWRWRPGITEASAPVSAWRTLGFDDSQFTTAPAPFWYDATGDSSTLVGGTQIMGMQNVYTSLFLRTTFVLTNTAEIAHLRLGALVDDGFVMWINGTEVQRVNVTGPAGDPVSITTLATNAVEPVPFAMYTLPVPPSYLVVGSNVLAVQLFQSTSAASSDIDFDASLESVVAETTPPTVLGASPSAGGTVNGLSAITVTFSEPVTGVDAADFLVNGVAAASVTPINSAVYSFGFAQPAYGTVQITWDASHSIVDKALSPNPFNATGPGATWQYNLVDQTPPTVATLSPAADATVRELTSIIVVFSESVTGVDAADLRINNTPATGVSGAADVYTFTFTQPATGLVQVAWAAGHGITDLAPAPNAFIAGGSWLYTLNPNAGELAGPVISEFMAANSANAGQPGAYLDEDGDSSDWIEIQNAGSTTVNLLNWSLTDETNNPAKWRFPATNMPPGGFLVVFASEKDRRVPGARLHTNFKLDGEGEYLALIRPDGSKASEFAPFPQQVSGVSYGLGELSTNSTLVPTNALVRVRIPSSGADGTNWLYEGFNDSAWTAGTNGVGYGVSVVPFMKTDVGPAMSNVNASAYIRLPFNIDNPSSVQALTLKVRFDDGFVAYLNGIELARANAPDTLAFNSSANNTHAVTSVNQYQSGGTPLRGGANVLAIQGLNVAAADQDFLVSAELTATHLAAASSVSVYMTVPTPGTANGGGVTVLGPSITEPSHSPNVPLDSQDVLVTARVSPTFALIGSVAVRYKVMFGTDIELPMFDDGMHGDGPAGDGVYGQTLPVAAVSTNGQMIRWYFRATDALGNVSRWPLFLSTVDTEYLGTIVDPTNVTSSLPIFHLFAAAGVLQTAPPTSQTGADGEAGGRISIFYDGEFYDNVYMELRGNTSAGQAKKSHRVEFNRNHRFRHLPGYPRILKTSFMAEFLDPTYIRQHLSFWLLEQTGTPLAPFFYPVRLQANSQFYALAFHNDVIGQGQIERMGLDPKGALYKAAGNVLIGRSSTGVFQKLEPDGPPDYTDYNQLCNGIVETATVANRRAAAFDMLDIPEVINYLACARWCAENDDVWANMSLHRDTYGDLLWRIIPFDMNASWGQRYGGITPLDAIADNCKSHPLYGGSTIIACDGSSYNRIYDVIIALPETRQMLLRRQRTVLDRWVMEPGVAPQSRLLETHIRYMTNLIWTEAFLDRAKWGYSTWTASNKPLPTGANELFNEFINLRRIHFSGTHCVTNVAKPIGITPTSNAGIPLSQPPISSITISSVEFNPASGNQEQEYIQIRNPNPYALDITGWKLNGGVEFTFKPGTVIPSNSVLYVSPNVLAFKQRTLSPRGGEGNFVVGPYSGQLNARGESLTIRDDLGRLVYSNSFAGAPSLAQQFLRVSEIMYNPSALAGNTNNPQEFEYLELVNLSPSVTLNLNGVRLTNGVDFAFAGSAVTSLGPNGRVVVVRNAAAFTARYGAVPNVAGQYVGLLDNAGERIRLLDASNEEILDFSYNNSWYPITDGLGFSLVNTNLSGEPDSWGDKSSWRPSGGLQGAPGQGDLPGPAIPPIRISEVLTHTDPPQRDTIELFNPTASPVNVGGWLLTDDFTNAMKFRITNGCIIPAGGFVTFDETLFTNSATALVPFALSSLGDEIFLFSGDPASTNLTGYRHGFNFGAADNGVSFGLYIDSQTNEHFVAQKTLSLGSVNAGPRVGPIVISEIMFHPPDNGDGSDNSQDEFIELRSITNAPTPLFTPTNNWRLGGGISFDFPSGATLAANTTLMIVAFDPADATKLASFRSRFNVPVTVPVYGPFIGKLDNSSDKIRLQKPGELGPNGLQSFILVDEVDYKDSAPWPNGADGSGASLQRRVAGDFGNDPANWVAATVTGGGLWSGGTLPTISAQPSTTSAGLGLSAMFSVSASGPGPLGYQWRLNGNSIAGANSSILTLSGVDFFDQGLYDVIVYNAAGSVLSSSAGLSVFIPATILVQPQSVLNLRVPPDPAAPVLNRNATFTIMAESTAPLTYQWRKDGVPIPGATGTSLTISNVVFSNVGFYSCAVTDANGTIYSADAILGVLPYMFSGSQPMIVPEGADISVSAVVQAYPPPFLYSWRRGTPPNTNIISALGTNFATWNSTAAGYVLINNILSSNYALRLVFTNLGTGPNGVALINNNNFITVVADTDHDGIPNTVEVALSLDPLLAADGDGDLDGDGMSNADEYRAGTDPNNPASNLRVLLSTVPGQATVRFGAVSNKTYTIQYSDSLPAPFWSRLADVVALNSNRVESFVDPTWTTNRFYQAVTPRQP